MAAQSSSLVFLQYLTTVFDSIADAILLIGVEPKDTFRFLLANQSFFRSTGHSHDELGKEISAVVSPDSYVKLVKQYRKVVATKRPVEYTTWYNVPMGKQVFEVKLLPILNTVGECVNIAAITHNITDVSELRSDVERLQKTLHDITSLISQADLKP